MNSPAYEFHNGEPLPERVDRLFKDVRELEEAVRSNTFEYRRNRQNQLGEAGLQELIEDEREKFYDAMIAGSSTRYIPPGIDPAHSITLGQNAAFSMPHEHARLTVVSFGVQIQRPFYDKAALIVQHVEGTDGYGKPFVGESILTADRHPRQAMGYWLNPDFRIFRISDPVDPDKMLILNPDEIFDDTNDEPGLTQLEQTVAGLLMLYKNKAERVSEAKKQRKSPDIGSTTLRVLPFAHDERDQPPHA